MKHCSFKRFAVLVAALALALVITSESQAQRYHGARGHHHPAHRHHGGQYGYSSPGVSIQIGGSGFSLYSRNYGAYYGYRGPRYYAAPSYRPACRTYGGYYSRPSWGGIYFGW
ncbi:MAG: hypothetical protein MK106_03250 [Mariniblastus sp.]|nr:hypothetical protein [Mariniblastus sp.]